jgi:hypothetical protein
MSEAKKPFEKGDPEWWKHWKDELSNKGVIAEVKYHIMRISNVDEIAQEFEAHVRVDARVALQDRGHVPRAHRQSFQHKPLQVVKKDDNARGVEQFDILMQFMNLKRTTFKVSRWSRTKGDNDPYNYYSMEVSGCFGIDVRVATIPLDIQQLSINVTTDWDSSILRFAEWKEGDQKSRFEVDLCYELKRGFTISRKIGLAIKTLEDTPASPGGYKYAEVRGTVVVKRHYTGTMFLLVVRPLILSMLAFAVFYMPPDVGVTGSSTLSNRLNISLIVLLAFAVEPRKAGDTIRYVEYYVIALFICLCGIAAESIFVFGFTNNITDQLNGDRIGFSVMAAYWLITNGVFVSYIGGRILWLERTFRLWDKTPNMVDLHTIVPAEQ